jgi:hypothetical protein
MSATQLTNYCFFDLQIANATCATRHIQSNPSIIIIIIVVVVVTTVCPLILLTFDTTLLQSVSLSCSVLLCLALSCSLSIHCHWDFHSLLLYHNIGEPLSSSFIKLCCLSATKA